MLLPSLPTGVSGLHFGSEDPLGNVLRTQWHHHPMTVEAATAAGWDPAAAQELGRHSAGVDLYLYHPVWRVRGGRRRWRAARLAERWLEGVHFDNLAGTAEVSQLWEQVTGGARVALEWSARRDDVGAARNAIGVALHAIQDFYSHSRWIDDPARRTVSWLETVAKPEISTGGYGPGAPPDALPHGRTGLTPAMVTRLPGLLLGTPDIFSRRGFRYAGPPGINLDSRWQAAVGVRTRGLDDLTGDEAFEVARALAVRDSQAFLGTLGGEFADRVRRGPATDWTRSFEDPARLPYQFVAAGGYPPDGRGDAGRKYLRVLASESARLRFVDAAGGFGSGGRVAAGLAGVGRVPVAAAAVELTGGGSVDVEVFGRSPAALRELASGVLPAAGSGRKFIM